MECRYCSRTFKTQGGHDRHSERCENRALIEANGPMGARRAFELFNHWYLYNKMAKKPKTFDQFLRSPYRSVFLDLERLVSKVYLPSGQSYVQWLSDHHVPSRDWCKDSVLRRFKLEHAKEMDPRMVVMANLQKMVQWADRESVDISDFFSRIGPGESLVWIEAGKLTPWVLLATSKIDQLLDRMNQEQLDAFSGLVDLRYWDDRFSKTDGIEEIRGMLVELGL